MTEPAHLAALYNAAEIILWVEDLVTSAYLGELWQHDGRFKFYIGGGHETLAAVVEDARRSGRPGVFGLRDRDFGPTNHARWSTMSECFFALETFEIECFLLDAKALAACAINTGGRQEEEIEASLAKQASELVWWMACRRVIAGLREARQQDFPAHPKRTSVPSREAARDVLLENDWVKRTAPGLAARVEARELLAALDAAHDDYAGHIASGTWKRVFSGKEIVEPLVSWIYTRGRPPGSAGVQDLAKAVAREQVRAGRAPAELLELRDVLVARRRT